LQLHLLILPLLFFFLLLLHPPLLLSCRGDSGGYEDGGWGLQSEAGGPLPRERAPEGGMRMRRRRRAARWHSLRVLCLCCGVRLPLCCLPCLPWRRLRCSLTD
jgi:hypothetical protein